MKPIRTILAGGVLAVAAAPQAVMAASETEAAVGVILDSSVKRFEALKGTKLDFEKAAWLANYKPEGMVCVIRDEADADLFEYSTLTCSTGQETDLKIIQAQRKRIEKALAKIEPDWVWFRVTQDPSDAAEETYTGPSEGELRIALQYAEDETGLYFIFRVDDQPFGVTNALIPVPKP